MPSEALIGGAAAAPVKDVTTANFMAEVVDGSFDAVFTHNYIEHVQNPVQFFRECRALIKANGTMAHSSPCYQYLYEASPFHLFFPLDPLHK